MPALSASQEQEHSTTGSIMNNKRKRELGDGETDGAVPANGSGSDSLNIHTWMKDVLDVLKRNDGSPSILDFHFESAISTKPSPKRNKASESSMNLCIAKKIKDAAYTKTDELIADLDTASSKYLKEVEEKVTNGKLTPRQAESEKSGVATLKKRLNGLIAGEMFQRQRTLQQHSHSEKHPSQDLGGEALISAEGGINNSMILTLVGGERSAKQLFSSLAKPGGDDTSLTERPLPNGITTTSVIPVHTLEEGKEKVTTIGQSFPPPSSLKALNPPRPASKHTSTRSNSINWYSAADAAASPKESSTRDPYPNQPLPSGRWLTYNVPPTSEQFNSPGSRRKHRERALSSGEPPSAIDKETSKAHAQAQDDALYCSVYSSFAPSRDDTGAIVSEEQKNRLWWSKYGEAQYNEILDARDDLLYGPDEMDQDMIEEELDEKVVEEAIAEWKPLSIEEISSFDKSKEASSREAEDLLQEISELLEILNSHQRVRNLSQPATARPLQGQKEQLATAPLDPSTPSSSETEVYEDLKKQLVEVISTLPPYMLSKLNGDRLEALQLSTKLKYPYKNQKGTLEDDWTSPKAKVAPSGTYSTYGAGAAVRGAYAPTPVPQYPRQAPVQASVQRQAPSAGYAASQYSGRPAPVQYGGSSMPRPSYGQYPQQRSSSSSSYVDRFANGQYTPQHSYSSYSQYQNSYRPPMGQQANSYGQQYASPQPRVAPASTPTGQGYQQRPPGPPTYNYGATPGGPTYTPPMSQGPPFTGQAVVAGQQRPPLYQQHSSHYGSHSPAAEQMNGMGVDGAGRMSPASLDARPSLQGSVTPQPASGQSPRPNGTPAPQPNGVTA
ncbi:uncharacterized protein KY384_005698 [Bacidia gigantensis]|uniref:uncharacterized protein n=1 Tax=Bacidia gigantensis TaxID=2732470 RepID=UPI001D04A5BF|nr:uncharacterized protein KY384_005698 [Bacidia gigantensis]KAG8529063.1 hypothetical protein KY384_005698 [Bacidia gigantensis]